MSTKANVYHALEYLDRGLSVMPISSDTKRPLIMWQRLQNELPTEEEVVDWWSRWPNADIGIITGAISGIVVVDCDNDVALNAAMDLGWGSPVRVKTKRGQHLYFKHPMDGVRRGNRAGVNSRGEDWPVVNGLDFRGDGGYVKAPPSSGYLWINDDFDDCPVWQDWRPSVRGANLGPSSDFTFEELDLSVIHVTPFDFTTEWDRTEQYIQEQGFPYNKIPTGLGNGRNTRVHRYAAEQVWQGKWGPELRRQARVFMNHFFVEPLPEREFDDTIGSVERAHRSNHPEHFNGEGEFTFQRADVKVEREESKRPRRLILSSDGPSLILSGQGDNFLIAPFLRPNSITQIYGYSGSGKTRFLQGAVYALAAGAPAFGPFSIQRPAKVLYMDFEMSQADLGRRLVELDGMFGSAEDRLQVWTPWLEDKHVNFRKQDGLQELDDIVSWSDPEVVVIDTVRTAWSGISENDAKEWAQVNEVALRLRNAGRSVVLLHHSNKPGDSGVGREAGSTNQLTVLEQQLRVAQVYRDRETATIKAGIFDEDHSIHDRLASKLPQDFFLSMVLEISYAKVRQWTDLHDQVQYVAWATHAITGKQLLVSSSSAKQRAVEMARKGDDPVRIAVKLSRPLDTIKAWLEEASEVY